MLSWLFKKSGTVGAPKVTPSPHPALRSQADAKAKPADDGNAVWLPQLQSAQGDEAALLRVAQAAPVLEIKLAAVEALVTEEALKQAERELRGHDRRVHRVAKRRLEAAVAQRVARTRAQALIETAGALTEVALVPANRLVELDRDWQSLDTHLLDPAQSATFTALRDRLNAVVRERGEAQQHAQRWAVDATRALAELQSACAEAAAHGSGDTIAPRSEVALALRASRPDIPATAALNQTLQAALQTAALLEARLAWLATLEHSGVEPAPAPGALTPPQHWRALPALADAGLARMLNERFDRWQRGQVPAPLPAPVPRLAPAAARALSSEQRVRLDRLLQQAEAALAEGQLGAMQQHLQAIDAVAETTDAVMPDDALRARHQVLLAERARLKGWQQWGGGLAREGLLAEAEDLAGLALACADPQAAKAAKLNLKVHGDAIHALRQRWKELDHLGAPASQTLWQRFDAALQTAYQPVAAQQGALKAAREDNLSAREALLATLEAVPVEIESTHADDVAAHWKEQVRALERFQLAWRQLGPLEHTVPAKSRSALQQRLRDSVERIEAPLQEARRAAEALREQLIVEAQALAQELGSNPKMRDAGPRLRELQAQWQQHARTLPLARAVENALWARFKGAVDAVFAQRDAALGARDAELAANLAMREALIERLAALAGDTPAAEIQRTLAEVDRSWREIVELPRDAAGAIEARFREARAAALKTQVVGVQRRWQAQCDALVARLALCEEREQSTAADPHLAERWAAHDALPAAWEQALAQRWSRPVVPGPMPVAEMDEVLLRLEAALDLPVAPEWLAARRDQKLRALKDTLEGRAPQTLDPARRADWLAAALQQSGATTTQRERLRALIAALRQAPPGSPESPGSPTRRA